MTRDWYIVEVNTSKNFKVLRSMLNSVMPKGCSVFVTSYNNYSKKQRGKLGKRVFLTDYLFILCNLEKHMPKIISNIESLGVSARVLIDAKDEPVKFGSTYDSNKSFLWLSGINTDFDVKIANNLPYAHRGYVFEEPELKKYFEQFWWYMPDKKYKKNTDGFTEKDWEYINKKKGEQ